MVYLGNSEQGALLNLLLFLHSVRAMLVSIHRVRSPTSVRPHTADAEQLGYSYPHPEPGSVELSSQPLNMLHVLPSHLY